MVTIPPPAEPLDPREMRWYAAMWNALAAPRAVTVRQVITAGLKVALGVVLLAARPEFLLAVAGGVPSSIIGATLILGGAVAMWGAFRTHPALEEIGLRLAQVGLVGLFAVVAIIVWDGADGISATLLFAFLIAMAVLDADKRIETVRWRTTQPLTTLEV